MSGRVFNLPARRSPPASLPPPSRKVCTDRGGKHPGKAPGDIRHGPQELTAPQSHALEAGSLRPPPTRNLLSTSNPLCKLPS